MKYYIFTLLSVICMLSLSSCDLETSGNGDLDGMWHLVRVDTLSTGGVKQMEQDRIYWLVQFKLLQLDDKNGTRSDILMRFEHNGNTLRLFDPYIYDRTDGDKPLTDVSLCAPFGVNALDETFKVESLDGKKMVLSTDSLRLSFRKL